MKIFKLFTVVLIAAVCLTACQKELSNELLPVVPVLPADDSIYLSKIYGTETDGITTDTTGTITYQYDAMKRVITVVDSSDLGTNDILLLHQSFSYYGNDTLPYRSQSIQTIGPNVDTITRYHFYDASGNKIKDSSDEYSVDPMGQYVHQQEVKNYSYTPGFIYGFTYVSRENADTVFYKDTAMLDANKNVVSNKKYQLFGTGNYELAYTATITYDQHPSPFALLSNFKALLVFPSRETLLTEMPQYNNRLTIQEMNIQTGHPSYGEEVSYTYKPNGYPLVLTDNDNNTGIVSKALFVYKSL